MSKRNAQHVIQNSTGKWSVRKSDSSRASRLFDSKTEAIDYARKAALQDHSELVIHKKDGTVIEKRNYAAQSLPPKIGDRGKRDDI